MGVDQSHVRSLMRELSIVQWRKRYGLNAVQCRVLLEYHYLKLGLKGLRGGKLAESRVRRQVFTESYKKRRLAELERKRTEPRCRLPPKNDP